MEKLKRRIKTNKKYLWKKKNREIRIIDDGVKLIWLKYAECILSADLRFLLRNLILSLGKFLWSLKLIFVDTYLANCCGSHEPPFWKMWTPNGLLQHKLCVQLTAQKVFIVKNLAVTKMKRRQRLMITVHSLTENRYLCRENVHNGKRISLSLQYYIYLKRVINSLYICDHMQFVHLSPAGVRSYWHYRFVHMWIVCKHRGGWPHNQLTGHNAYQRQFLGHI